MNGTLPLRIGTALLAAFCFVGLVRCAAIAGLHVPLDPNEGWNAYHTLHAMSGSALYPPASGFLFNNYPPLSFYVVGALGSIIGDNIVAGRILSLLATLSIAAGLYLAARRMRIGAVAALFASLLFVAGLLVFTDYVGMDDPQLLGHAVAMIGFVVLLNERRTANAVIGAALLMALAFFIKHNLVALPIAFAIWLAIFDRRSALWFATSGFLFGLVGLAAFRIAYGVDLFSQLNSARTYSLAGLTSALGSWLVWAEVSLFGLAALIFLRRDDKRVALCAIYAAVAIVVGILFAGGAGVDMNIWFDAMIALSLAAALALDRLSTLDRMRATIASAYALPLVAGIILNWDDGWLDRNFWLYPLAEEAAGAQADTVFLKAHAGPVACEMLSLCYWAGKPEEIDMFNLGQAYAAHRRPDDALARLIVVKHFGSIEFDSLDDFALTPRIKQTLLKTYRVDHANDEGAFFVPR